MSDLELFAGELPESPLPVLERWLDEAAERLREHNPTAMTLATVDAQGGPDARMVICRGYDSEAGWLVFYSDRTSAKGHQLRSLARAALVFYWEPLSRSLRISGPVSAAPDAQSDAYFASRPAGSRLAAWASDQSEPIASRAELEQRYREVCARYGLAPETDPEGGAQVPRPPRWGGYRVWAESVEFWVGRENRLHDRAHYSRVLEPDGDGFKGGPWRATRLQP